MKKILVTLCLCGTYLFANSLVGTWTIDEAKTKASLKASSLKDEELIFTQRLVLHVMKSLECTANNTCIMTQLYKGNSSTGKYTYKAKAQGYVLEGNNQQLIVSPTDNAGIKVLIPDISKEKLAIFYSKTKSYITVPPKTVTTHTLPIVKKMVSATTKLIPSKVSDSPKVYTSHAEVKVKTQATETQPHTTHERVSATPDNHIVDIDIKKEKRLEKIKADTEYWKAVQEVS